MIGYSAGNSATMPRDLEFGVSDPATAKGVTASRKDFFEVNDVAFYNFDKPGQSALFDCSQCFVEYEAGRATRVSGLHFDAASVLYRLSFQTPFMGVIEDMDGSLTGRSVPSGKNMAASVTAYLKHNHHRLAATDPCAANHQTLFPDADYIVALPESLICEPSVQVRRVAFYDFKPFVKLRG